MAFIFEQSDSEIYASHAGLAVVGPIINRHSGLRKRLKSIPLRHGILHIDLVRTYLGLLCQGKNDFEAVEEVRKDLFFQQALEIGRVPSSARLRQRFDEQAEALTQAADDCIVPMLKNLRATVSALPTGHVALHADVFCLDNSKTRKEGVARTYHGYDGYAPIGAYLGEEGWCVGLELRPGDQHSQKDFLFFLDRVLPRARALAGNRPLLITLRWRPRCGGQPGVSGPGTDRLPDQVESPQGEPQRLESARRGGGALCRSIAQASGWRCSMKWLNGALESEAIGAGAWFSW